MDGVVTGSVRDEPDGVGSSLDSICFDLELYDSEIMENIGASNVENDSRVNRHPEEIGVCTITRISENPVELVASDVESWAALSRDLSLIVGRNAITPSSVRGSIWKKSVHSRK